MICYYYQLIFKLYIKNENGWCILANMNKIILSEVFIRYVSTTKDILSFRLTTNIFDYIEPSILSKVINQLNSDPYLFLILATPIKDYFHFSEWILRQSFSKYIPANISPIKLSLEIPESTDIKLLHIVLNNNVKVSTIIMYAVYNKKLYTNYYNTLPYDDNNKYILHYSI